MSNHLNKEIFTETGCLSREQILQYKDGLLRRSDMHRVERHLIDCDLCSEALEGLAMVANTAVLDDISNHFQKKNDKPGYSNKNYLAIAATATGIVFLTYFAIDQLNSVKNEQQIQELAIKESETPQSQSPSQKAQPDISPDSQISNFESTKQEIIQNQKAVLATKPNARINLDYPKEESNSEMASRYDLAAGSTVEDAPPTASDAIEVNMSTLDERKDAVPANQQEGLQKRKGSEYNAISEAENVSSVSMDVIASQTEAVTNSTYSLKIGNPIALYKKGRYEEAILGFNQILSNYPNDESASYHKGMSLFELKRFNEALVILKPMSETPNHSFMQAAEFQTAACYEALGKKDIALNTYRKIVNGDGLYKSKAAKRIKALE